MRYADQNPADPPPAIKRVHIQRDDGALPWHIRLTDADTGETIRWCNAATITLDAMREKPIVALELDAGSINVIGEAQISRSASIIFNPDDVANITAAIKHLTAVREAARGRQEIPQ